MPKAPILLSYPPSEPSGVERCRFLGVGRLEGMKIARLELDGEVFCAEFANPEVLRGDLPFGAEIEVAFEGPGRGRAELRLGEEDRLCPELRAALRKRYWAPPYCMIRERGSGWDYLMLISTGEEEACALGPIALRGPTAILMKPERVWRIRGKLLDRVHQVMPPFPLKIAAWEFSREAGARESAYPELTERDIDTRFGAIVSDRQRTRYWSDRFDPDFYVRQAGAGFIAIAYDRGDRRFLMPTLHTDYAVLDWNNLHRGRSIDRLFRSGRLEAMGVRLVASPDLRPVLEGLARQWKERSWLLPEYRDLMLALTEDGRSGLRPWGIELRVDGEEEPVAGELGYTFGSAYTSLSGFHRLERREWSGLGTVQLHLLAGLLRERGCAFWNLGDPRMRYKLDLGARLMPREEFLPRWRQCAKADDTVYLD